VFVITVEGRPFDFGVIFSLVGKIEESFPSLVSISELATYPYLVTGPSAFQESMEITMKFNRQAYHKGSKLSTPTGRIDMRFERPRRTGVLHIKLVKFCNHAPTIYGRLFAGPYNER
jgi:hypothetical protein